VACPGEGPRALGGRSSQLGNGNLPHKPPIPDTPGPKICLGWALEWHRELLHYDTPAALPERILRAADNLFVFQLPLEEDVKGVAKSGMIEEASLTSLVKALPQHACLGLGETSGEYPVVLLPDPLAGCKTKGKTRYYFYRSKPSLLSKWQNRLNAV